MTDRGKAMSLTGWLGRGVSTAVGLMLAGGAAFIGLRSWMRATSSDRMMDPDSVPPRPVGLVLGAEVYPSGVPSPFLKGRLDLAAELYHAGKVEVLLVSGDDTSRSNHEPTAMRRYLMSEGVPDRHIVIDRYGFDTYDSCVRAHRTFGVDALTIISQSFHLPRAITICQAVGIDAIGVGDESVRAGHRRTWRYGVRRESLANIKAGYDLLTQRSPRLGPPETGVQEALLSAR